MFKKKTDKKAVKQKEAKDYTLKKNTLAKVLRVVFWGCIIFLIIRGIVAIIKPDRTDVLMDRMKQVESGAKEEIQQNSEILSFTEDFVKQWQTYTNEEEFKSRLAAYVVPAVLEQQNIHDFTSTSKATYVNAYRMEDYAAGQYDVYVEVIYTNTRMVTVEQVVETEPETEKKNKKKTETETPQTEVIQQPVTVESTKVLKVPIQVTEDGKYIAEGIPLVIDDQENLPGKYRKEEVTLEVIEEVATYQEMLTNYLKAYYSESQSVSEYYLSPDAKKSNLYGFADPGKVEFIALTEVKAFRKAAGEVLCIATYQIRDIATEAVSLQQCNIVIDDSEVERLYIKELNTKAFNLKMEVAK